MPEIHVDLTSLITSLILACGPVVLGWVVHNVWIQIRPILARYMDERTLAAFQARFDAVAHQAIAFAVQKGADRVTAGQPITLDIKNWLAGEAVEYVTRNAPDTAAQAGQVLEKVLARFDLHPAVQALVVPGPPAEPVTAN